MLRSRGGGGSSSSSSSISVVLVDSVKKSTLLYNLHAVTRENLCIVTSTMYLCASHDSEKK